MFITWYIHGYKTSVHKSSEEGTNNNKGARSRCKVTTKAQWNSYNHHVLWKMVNFMLIKWFIHKYEPRFINPQRMDARSRSKVIWKSPLLLSTNHILVQKNVQILIQYECCTVKPVQNALKSSLRSADSQNNCVHLFITNWSCLLQKLHTCWGSDTMASLSC